MSPTAGALLDAPSPTEEPPTPARSVTVHRRLRALLARDSTTFARGRAGKLLVAAGLITVPVAMVLLSVIGDRYGRYADDSWKALLMLVVLLASYLVTRRLLLTVIIGAVAVAVASWVLAPNLAAARNGDPAVLAHLDHQASMGTLAGYESVAVAEVDLDSTQPVRLAGIGANATTPMEVGSMTKAMTGLVIADAVRRGEIRMDAPVSTYLPRLQGSPAGTVTMQELVTHTSGYAEFGGSILRSAAWKAPMGLNFFTSGSTQMTKEARAQKLGGRGEYAYSTLGSAIAGQAVAAKADLSYADLMRTRLFEPLGMRHTAIEVDRRTRRRRQVGDRPARPAMGDGCVRPRRCRRLDRGRPGEARHRTPRRDRARHVRPRTDHRDGPVELPHRCLLAGLRWQTGQTITWHAGQTGGYASYLALDRARHKAVVVLSDVANDASDLGSQLLADRHAAQG